MGKELVCIILECNVSVVLSQMFSDGPDLRDADLGASQYRIERDVARGIDREVIEMVIQK